MRLYYFPVAPNPSKVRIYLREKGLALEEVFVNLGAGEQRQPAFLARNALGTLPVLELDDGSTLSESLPIIEYLEELHPDPPLWGTTPEARARARELERLCDQGVLLPIARIIHATKSPLGLPARPEIAQSGREQLEATLGALDARIGAGPFAAGAHVSVADCTLAAAFGFADFAALEIDPGFRNVAAWRARFAERPSTRVGF
jgi:glutathione S-transferase